MGNQGNKMTPNEKHVSILANAMHKQEHNISVSDWIEDIYGDIEENTDEGYYSAITAITALTAMQTLQEECDATILSMQNRIDELEKENLELFNELNQPKGSH